MHARIIDARMIGSRIIDARIVVAHVHNCAQIHTRTHVRLFTDTYLCIRTCTPSCTGPPSVPAHAPPLHWGEFGGPGLSG